jgi:hypothetical protein
MGFNKRFVEKELLERYFENNKPLKELFKADAFIFMDDISSKAYDYYCDGLSDELIKIKIKQYEDAKSNQSN